MLVAVNIINLFINYKLRIMRPKIKDYFGENATLQQVVDTYKSQPELFNYAQALDWHIDEIEKTKSDLLKLLQKIEKWEMPVTNQFWDKDGKEPISYSAAYGSNGERDYIKSIAKAAISEGVEL